MLIWIVFGQAIHNGFVNFDDDVYIYENGEVSRGVTLDGLKWMLTHSHANLWHPLTTFSHMLDCQIYGLRPAGHHFTNIALHNLAAVLLFLVFFRMTGYLWRSAFVAGIFAIHPMRVESVAWIAERKDVLSGVFFALTLAAYVRYARRPDIARYLTMSILFVCALLSKATVVTVPVLLLLLDYWPLKRASVRSDWRRLVMEKLPLLVCSAAISVVTTVVQTITRPSLAELPFLPRIKNAAFSTVVYLGKMFWPTNLAVFYPHPHDQLKIWSVIAAGALIIALTLGAVFVRRSYPYVFVGWFWYLLMLVPVCGIVQAGLQGRADRFTYLPHIGITILLTWTIADLTSAWRNRQVMLTIAATGAMLFFAVVARAQMVYWHDSISLWEHALRVTSNNQIAHQDLAGALAAEGKTDKARIHWRLAGIIHARTTLGDYPFDVTTHDDLGVLLLRNGDPRGAVEQWETSLEIDPTDGNAQNNLAWVLATYPDDSIRNGDKAVTLAENATKLPGGESPIVFRTLAAAYAEAGKFPNAIDAVERAIKMATAQKNESLVQTLGHEVELYRADKPYRETPPE